MKARIEKTELIVLLERRFDLTGSLYLRGTGITSLPDNLSVGGFLDRD